MEPYRYNIEEAISLTFTCCAVEFWRDILYHPEAPNSERIGASIVAVLMAILFPIFLPILYTVLCLDDTMDSMNVYNLNKLEILKLQATSWFVKTSEYFLGHCKLPNPKYSYLSNTQHYVIKAKKLIKALFVISVLCITAPIMFTAIYIFFISTQKYFAKQSIINELRKK